VSVKPSMRNRSNIVGVQGTLCLTHADGNVARHWAGCPDDGRPGRDPARHRMRAPAGYGTEAAGRRSGGARDRRRERRALLGPVQPQRRQRQGVSRLGMFMLTPR
jgi:hypothetical protein